MLLILKLCLFFLMVVNVVTFMNKKECCKDDRLMEIIYGVSLTFIIFLSLFIGEKMDDTFTTKHPKKPIVKVECIDNKCDTSYTYNFK